MTHPLWIAAGIGLWALHFAAVYGLTGLACARGLGPAVPWGVAASTLLAAAMAAMLLARGLARPRGFVPWMTAAVAAMALFAIVLEGLPALWMSPCASR